MKSIVFLITGSLVSFLSFSQNSDSATFYYNRGVKENAGRLYAVAAKDLDKAISFNSKFTEAYIANGEACLSMRMISKAQENFNKAYELDPNNMEVINHLTTLSFNNRQFQKAINFANQCKNCEMKSRVLGMCYYNLEDYGKAEKYLKEAITKNDKDAEAIYTLGRTFLELEDEKSAISQYQKAVESEPTRSQWLYELGLLYYNRNEYKNSLKYFDLAADNGFNKTNDFYENYGFAQLYSGDTENGIKSLNIVLERKPNNKELLNNMARAMYDTQKYKEALDYFTKILNLDPKDATTMYMAGLTFQKLGQKEKGQKICDHAIEMDPSLSKYRQKNEMPQGL
ncbi:MAG: tetratricopeptide repeat protein [Ginsengibacter sp.]